jgi:RHS repeat-associated protein
MTRVTRVLSGNHQGRRCEGRLPVRHAGHCVFCLLLSVSLILAACASGGGGAPPPTTNPSLAIADFNPKSASEGTLITVTGSNFAPSGSPPPQVTLSKQGGGSLNAPLSTFSGTSLSIVIPAGAATGPLVVTAGTQTATSASVLTVTTSSSFALGIAPMAGNLIPGQSTTFSVSINSSNGFNELATLAVAGMPSGVTASFMPNTISAGQISVLTISAPANQATGTSTLTLSASASIDGQAVTQSATASLQVTGVTTSFIGRTVVDDSKEIPIGGVTIKFLGVDDKGNITGCSANTRSDAGGNFALTQLPAACTGPQLISYDGSTATSPAGKYAGVNLSYTLTSDQVTTSPVLIHLPRIDNAETVQVKQNAPADQVLTFQTIPGLVVTVYAGTKFSLDDGSQPNPFPLVGIEIPVDRLPDAIPTSGMLTPFIVAFQPANAVSSQPVAVNFPNPLNVSPGQTATFVTLDPTRGFMVPYGTGTVSNDGTQFVADPDPSHVGHAYGLVHFDWHGPAFGPPPPGNVANPSSDPIGPKAGDPVDVASGLLVLTNTDLAMGGARGQIAINRIYRSISTNPGPFGFGTNHNYGYSLDLTAFNGGGNTIDLFLPDGNRFRLIEQADKSFVNTTVPGMLGAVLTSPSLGTFNLRWKNGTTYQFQKLGPFVANLNSITDSNGNVITLVRTKVVLAPQIIQIIDPVGRALTLSYDSLNRITSIADPIGQTVRYTYNSQGTLSTVTDPAGGVTTYTYDPLNHLTQITDPRGIIFLQNTYDVSGRVVKQVHGDGGVTKFSYTLLNPTVVPGVLSICNDCLSPVIAATVTDPLGNLTSYRFSPQGYLLNETNALGQITAYTRDPRNGLPSSITDPLNRTTTFIYGPFGDLISVTRLDGTTDAATTLFAYDPVFSRLTRITDPLGHTLSIGRDAFGNPISITDALHHQTTLTYDSTGELLTITDPLGNTAKLAYLTGDLVSVTDPLGRVATQSTDAASRVVSVTSPLGQSTRLQYDSLNHITQITDALGGQEAFRYDANQSLLSVTDALGHSTTYTYDQMDRPTTRTDPSGLTESYQYDLAGNLVKFADRRGKATTYSYDALNRKTVAGFGAQPGPTFESTVNYAHDAVGRGIHAVDSVTGAIDRTFDGLDRLTSEVTPQGTISYVYDAAGRRTSMTVAGQPTVNYSYDIANRLTQLAQGTSTVSFAYDALNRRTNLTLPNSVALNYTFDGASQLTGITYQHGSATLGNLTYAYDNSGRAVSVGGSFARTGLPPAVATANYNAGNQLTKFGAATLTYDSNGNLTNDGPNTYTWDARNRLASIISGGSTIASFQYDPVGRRISKTAGGASASFLYDMFNPAQELVGSSASANLLTGLGVDEFFSRTDSAGTRHFLTGNSGSTLALTDSTGAMQTSYTYEPFGSTVSSGPPSTNSFQYTGRENDATGLYYYRFRYYSPKLQRFISEDPIGFLGGFNLYAYTDENPISNRDPLGLDKKKRDKCKEDFYGQNYGSIGSWVIPKLTLLRIIPGTEEFSGEATKEAGIEGGLKLGALKLFNFFESVGEGRIEQFPWETLTQPELLTNLVGGAGAGVLEYGVGPLITGLGAFATTADLLAGNSCYEKMYGSFEQVVKDRYRNAENGNGHLFF